jgi:hypothetical protein
MPNHRLTSLKAYQLLSHSRLSPELKTILENPSQINAMLTTQVYKVGFLPISAGLDM